MGWFQRFKPRIASDVDGAAPIIESPHDRGFEREFRHPGDPPHVIHINQQPPKGLPRKLVEYVEVAGVSHDEARRNAEAFIQGTSRRVELERDPTNQYDRNAIKVIGVWRDSQGTEHRGRIGWVPSVVAKDIAVKNPSTPIGATIKTMFKPRKGKGPGIRIDIWCPKAKTKKS